MDNLTRAARERLLIGLTLAEEACDEIEDQLSEHTCCQSESVPLPGEDCDDNCPLCTLYRDAICIGYAITGQRSCVENDVRCDLLRVTKRRLKKARGLLAELTADQSPALALLAEAPPRSKTEAEAFAQFEAAGQEEAPAVVASLSAEPTSPGNPSPAYCRRDAACEQAQDDNNAKQLRLLRALREARAVSQELEHDLEDHTCKGRQCDLFGVRADASGMAWLFEIFHSLLDSVTVGGPGDVEYQEYLAEQGLPVPPETLAPIEAALPAEPANPFYGS